MFDMCYTATAGRSEVGHPLDVDTQMGSVISRDQYEKSLDAIAAVTSADGKVLAGGVGPTRWDPMGGTSLRRCWREWRPTTRPR